VGLIETFLSDVAVSLLSKLGDIQALFLGQIVFPRQLVLIIGDIGFIFIIRLLTIKFQVTVESQTDLMSERSRSGQNWHWFDSLCPQI